MLESLDNGKPLSASKGGDLPQVMTACKALHPAISHHKCRPIAC